MEIWCIHLRKSLETIASLTFSNKLLTVLKAGYNLDTMRQTACLVFNPIRVESYAALFNCMAVVLASDSMTAST